MLFVLITPKVSKQRGKGLLMRIFVMKMIPLLETKALTNSLVPQTLIKITMIVGNRVTIRIKKERKELSERTEKFKTLTPRIMAKLPKVIEEKGTTTMTTMSTIKRITIKSTMTTRSPLILQEVLLERQRSSSTFQRSQLITTRRTTML